MAGPVTLIRRQDAWEHHRLRGEAIVTDLAQWSSVDGQLGVHHVSSRLEEVTVLPHAHGEYNVTFCLSGTVEIVVVPRREVLKPRDALIVNPGQIHYGRYGTRQESEGITIRVSVPRMAAMVARLRLPFDPQKQSLALRGPVSDGAMTLLRELRRELLERKRGYESVLEAAASYLLVTAFRNRVEILRSGGTLRPRQQLPTREMEDALHYMNSCRKSDFSMTVLCSRLGTSPSRFLRLFKNSAGLNPHSYYNHLLVTRAAAMLRSTEHSIKSIAYDLGFKNDSHFCRVFREVSGTSPDTYRSRRSAPMRLER